MKYDKKLLLLFLVVSFIYTFINITLVDALEVKQIVANEVTTGSIFGSNVSISGDYVLVGAKNEGLSGGAYIFVRNVNDWNQETKLVPNDLAKNSLFGNAVSIYNDYAIIGACNDDEKGIYSGSAYIYKRKGSHWEKEAKLIAVDGDKYDHFGNSVSINNNYAIVGAPRNNNKGAVYFFKRDENNWIQDAKMVANDIDLYDSFGVSVSMSGNYAIVGSHHKDANSLNKASGAAYIFLNDNGVWSQQTKLIAKDENSQDQFGYSVDISGENAIVGALFGSAAYIFKRDGNNWFQQAKLVADDGGQRDNFGNAVSICGGMAIVGAYMNDDKGENSGAAYVYWQTGDRWTQRAKLIAYDRESYAYFSKDSVSISDKYSIVGCTKNRGSVYVFQNNTYEGLFSGYVKDISDRAFIGAKIQFNNINHVFSDENGFYNLEIPSYVWSGKIFISYNNYIFSPNNYELKYFVKDLVNQNFSINIYTISGFIKDVYNNPISAVEVKFSNNGGTAYTNSKGYYSHDIYHNWSGEVIVQGKGFKYEPFIRTYNNVNQCYFDQNYHGSKFTISGYCLDAELLPVAGVEVILCPKQIKCFSDQDGFYTFDVDFQWSGKITVSKTGYVFSSSFREYNALRTNIIDQNFSGSSETYAITGIIIDKNESPVQNITIKIVDSLNSAHTEIQTDEMGQFTYHVPHGWSGNFKPIHTDYLFDPQIRQVTSITTNMIDQTFIAALITQNQVLPDEWKQFNHNSFEFFGTLTCTINKNNESIILMGDYLFAFVDNEIRGVAETSLGPDGHLFFLQIWGNDKQQMNYKYYSISDNKIYNLAYKFYYEPKISIGSVQEPYVINLTDSNGLSFDFDVNNDNHIDLIDVLLIIKHLTGFH